MNILALHKLAASRGDGLDPRLAEFLEARSRTRAANVEDISAYRPGEFIQAGQHPVRHVDGALPPGVLQFPIDERPLTARKSAAS